MTITAKKQTKEAWELVMVALSILCILSVAGV